MNIEELECRTIQNEQEFEMWLDFVVQVFGYKKNPPSRNYFKQNCLNDPNFNYNQIIVLLENFFKIVGTIHILTRTQIFNKKNFKMGGIGDVAVSENYRGRGIAKILLSQASLYLQKNEFDISCLHTGNAVGLYQKFGWKSVNRKSFICAINFQNENFKNNYEIRQFQKTNIQQIVQIFNDFSVWLVNIGPILRSPDYFSKWILAKKYPTVVFDQNQIIAYIILDHDERIIYIREFCTQQYIGQIEQKIIFKTLIQNYLQNNNLQIDQLMINEPLGLLLDLQVLEFFEDNGFMYKIINNQLQQTFTDLIEKQSTKNHLYWELDGF